MAEETTTTTTQSTQNTETDEYDLAEVNLVLPSSHPLYLHPNDHPGMSLISQVLLNTNYSQWKRAMVIVISSKLKLGIVTELNKKPNNQSKYISHWQQCNDMVTSWLLNAVSPEIGASLVYFKTAKEIWEDLECRFTQGNAPQVFQIKKELMMLQQGSMSIPAYFTKFRSIWDEFEQVSNMPKCVCTCLCEAVKKMDEYTQLQKVTQFLIGLNDSYSGIRSTILTKSPLPNMSNTLALLMQDEKVKECSVLHTSVPTYVDTNVTTTLIP